MAVSTVLGMLALLEDALEGLPSTLDGFVYLESQTHGGTLFRCGQYLK